MRFHRISSRSTQELQQQRIEFFRGCQLQPMIGTVDPDVSETGIAVAFRIAHLLLGKENISVTPDTNDWDLYTRKRPAGYQRQICAIVIEARDESSGTRQSSSDVAKLDRIVKHQAE